MVQILLVTSGKGGVGKSTVSAFVAAALARLGRKTLAIELDAGLRTLDILLGVSDKAVFDLSDVLQGRCSWEKAALVSAHQPLLHLLTAPAKRGFHPGGAALAELCGKLRSHFDYLIFDTPAGMGDELDAALAVADGALLVATPDPVAMRDAASVASVVFEHGIQNVKLVINRVLPKPRQLTIRNLDEMIDTIGVQLIGVLPEDGALSQAAALGRPLPEGSLAKREMENIANRMEGRYVPLPIH